MATISASAARQTLPAQLDRVEQGEEVAITRYGRVVAVLVRPDALRARRAPQAWAHADEIEARLQRARSEPLPEPEIDVVRAEQLVAAIDADRSAL